MRRLRRGMSGRCGRTCEGVLELRIKHFIRRKRNLLDVSTPVTPAKAGAQNVLKSMDSGFRLNDKKGKS